MSLVAGIPLVELFDLADTVESFLPQEVQDFVDQFVVVDHRVSHADAAIFHRGTLQPVATAIAEIPTDFDIGIGRLSLPLLQTGIPFQLAFQRAAVTGNLEPAASAWRLDLSLEVFNLTVDALEPAIYVPETGATPRHLLRDPTRENVRITGSAVLRIERPAGGPVQVLFVDQPDPLDPAAGSGAVATLVCTPPHFFLGGSEYGLSVGRLQFDFSESYTPPDVLARGQGPGWKGFAIREATFYAPRNVPGIGDLSGGVKNVLIGSPVGLQGELEVQFGRTAMDPTAFQFKQVTSAGPVDLAIGGSGLERTVTFQGSQADDVGVLAGFVAPAPPATTDPADGSLLDWKARWTWPDGSEAEADSASGTVRHGQVLRVTPVEVVEIDADGNGTVEPTDFPHPEISFRFVAEGTGPTIDARSGGEFFENVTHLGGTADALGALTLEAVPGGSTAGTFEWQIEGQPTRRTGTTYAPQVSGLAGTHTLVLREKTTAASGAEEVRLARLRLQVLDEGALLVGCEAGVFDAGDDATALALAAVEDTFDLSDFHAEGLFNSRLVQATLDATDRAQVNVPADGLARVTVAAAGPAPVLPTDRHVQILMDFDTPNELTWGAFRPAGTGGGYSQPDLLAWAARYPGAQFVVIGRCDDIGSDAYNLGLANDRAARGRALLTAVANPSLGTPLPAASVFSRGEQSAVPAGSPNVSGLPDAAAMSLVGRLIHTELPESLGWPDARYDSPGVLSPHEPVRDDYRRVDIWAVGGTPAPEATLPSDTAALGAALRRSLVPASGRDPAPVTAGSPAIDYRVKLRIVWDSPTVSELKDAIPTLAEAEFAWTPTTMPLPDVGGQPTQLSREVLTVFVNWAHDARTGYTKASLGIKSEGDPDGLISTTTKPLVAALAFGPALLSGVDADTDLVGAGARVAALLAATAFAEVDFGSGDSLVGTGSKAALTSAAFETEMRSISDPGPDVQVRVLTDYVCTLHINGGVLGIATVPEQPMKIRYKRVGLEYDTSKTGWERFGLVYDSTSMEIEDPGRWQISGVLGSLLRIVEVAMGRGSVWIEGRIAVALEIGIVEISEAIIRLTFPPPANPGDPPPPPIFELRGFVLEADIPNTLQGEGRLRIEDGGVIRAGVSANIIPVGLGADAALALARMGTEADPWMFLSLYLGVQFNTPLPLAQSGLAIYGFKGLFTMNGSRNFAGLNQADPVGSELDWWRNVTPENKFAPDQGQFALGVGVVVGTMPDVSFCVSCAGMLVVAFPDVEVILGVDVNIIEVPDTTASDQGGQAGTITGLIVIDSQAVKLAASAQYTIPSVLEVKVPFAGYFPFPAPGSTEQVYVRIGSDGQTQHGRFGEPVTLKLLPGTLDAQAWTYLMIEQGGLPELGGDPRFSFEGFSVGFGAGWEIGWSAGPIKLSASAKVLVGFGTAPLMIKGGVFVAGELDLVVVSISARGELILEAREFKQADGSQDVAIKIEGEFCGEVDLFFFSISGCVGVSIDLSPDLIPPAPPSPVRGVSLTDRRDRLMGKATPGEPQGVPVFVPADPAAGASVDANHTVWPDTAPVIHFAHWVDNNLGSAQFQPGAAPRMARWFGSNALKYAYRLDSVELRERGGSAVTGTTAPLQSVWLSTPFAQPDGAGVDNPAPSESEGPNLKLLDWNPWAWVVNMATGGAGQPGDPVTTVEDLCDPKPPPRRACVLGRRARRAGYNRVRLRAEGPPQPPYASRFHLVGEPVLRVGTQQITGQALHTLTTLAGGQIVPGVVVLLPFAADVMGASVDRGYRLPAARRAIGGEAAGLQDIVLPWEGRFSQRVADPVLLLMICDAPGQGTPGGGDGGDGADGGARHCDAFDGLKTGGSLQALERPGMTITCEQAGSSMTLVDAVDQSGASPRAGQDGSGEIRLPDAGVLIRFDPPCDRVELHLLPQGGAVKGQAFDAAGQVLADGKTGSVAEPQVMAFDVAGVAAVRIWGGRDEAVLFKVCCRGHGGGATTVCESFDGLEPGNQVLRRLSWNGLEIEALGRRGSFRLSDAVDADRVPPAPGQDGRAELFFARDGIRLSLPKPCPAVELHLMTFTNEPVQAEGLDASGQVVAAGRTDGAQQVPAVLRLQPKAGASIVEVRLTGGGGEAVLYRLCCVGGAGRRRCIDFTGARLADERVTRFRHAALTFEALSGRPELGLVDRVDTAPEPDRSGPDRRAELSFGEAGLRIVLPTDCVRVELKLMLFAKVALRAQALDATGARVWRGATDEQAEVPQVLRIAGRGLRVVELSGGAGEAVLYEVCIEPSEGGGPVVVGPGGAGGVISGGADGTAQVPPELLAGRAATGAATVVTGLVGDALRDDWPGRLVERRTGRQGLACELVAFAPRDPRQGPWDGVRIEPPPGKTVTLVSACGIDQRAIDARANDVAVAATLRTLIATATLAAPDERREIVLLPDTEYEIVVGWSWQAWQPDDPSEQPPDIPSGSWTTGPADVLRFRTAPAQPDLNASEPQDGLNEHVFDVRDIDRYILGVEPADGRAVQFTGDRLWVHFDCGHVEQLLELYGRGLAIDIRRTDPRPQPGADLSAVTAPLALDSSTWTALPRAMQPKGYQRLNDALADPAVAPCLPHGTPMGGASLGVTAAVEPDADYDLLVVAPSLADPDDRPVVRATRFHTSRHANPRALLDALGYTSPSTSPYLPDDLIVPAGAALPAGAYLEGDAALDAALAAIDAGTLPLPLRTPRSYVVWSFETSAGWRVEALLVDSLEPLRREATVVDATGVAVQGVRVQPLRATLGTATLSLYRANARFTRVIFKPAAPVVLATGTEHALGLVLGASDSAELSGTRRLLALPSLIEREGL